MWLTIVWRIQNVHNEIARLLFCAIFGSRIDHFKSHNRYFAWKFAQYNFSITCLVCFSTLFILRPSKKIESLLKFRIKLHVSCIIWYLLWRIGSISSVNYNSSLHLLICTLANTFVMTTFFYPVPEMRGLSTLHPNGRNRGWKLSRKNRLHSRTNSDIVSSLSPSALMTSTGPGMYSGFSIR